MSSLELHTLLSVSQIAGRHHVVFPIADPALVSFGKLDDCYQELRLALTEHLRGADANRLSRFSLPQGCTSLEVAVQVPRADLPEKLQPNSAIGFPCVVIPHREDSWVVVLPLRLTVFVDRKSSVSERVTAEVKRHAAALELDGKDWLDLLPLQGHRLEPFTVTVPRPGANADEQVRSKKRFLAAHQDKAALETLRAVAEPLHGKRVKNLPPVVGRERPVATLDALLQGEERNSVMLVGEELVGKSAVISAWLQSLDARDDARFVFATSGAQLVAGMSGLGQWQERVRRVFEAAERLDAVLVFDSLRDLFTDRSGGAVDLASAIKPYLEQKRVRVLGEITPAAADLEGHRNPGFIAAFSPIRVPEQSRAEGLRALEARVNFAAQREPLRPNLDVAARTTVVDLADRYLPYRPFPGKAVRFFEELRDTVEREHVAEVRSLSPRDVYELFSLQSGIPTFLLREDRSMDAEAIRTEFATRLVGQEEAVRRVVDTICVVKAGLQPASKPLASFLFVGPTGVGKTELARSLARFLFADEERLLRFDMSEYSGPDSAARLISGAGPGEGLLTLKVRQEPFAVVLLDEIEKAHPSVFDLLLQVLGEARLTDARGRVAHFNNTIVIMTSNLGTQARGTPIGIGGGEAPEVRYEQEIRRFFRPEFINRIDRVIPFATLAREDISRVLSIVLERIAGRRGFAELRLTLEVSEAAQAELASRGFTPEYGARALRRVLEDHVVSPLARMLGALGSRASHAVGRIALENEPQSAKGGVLLRVTESPFRYEFVSGRGKGTRRELAGFDRIADVRRRVQRWMELPALEEVQERLSQLLSELSSGSQDDTTGSFAEMSSEHSMLSTRWKAFTDARQEVESLEELALVAILAGEAVGEIGEDLTVLEDVLGVSLLRLIVALRAQHRVTLRVQEFEAGTLNRWLFPLLEEKSRLGFRISVHVCRDEAMDPKAERGPFGPARSLAELRERLGSKSRKPVTVVLSVSGEDAGTLLALEAGLHRWERTDGNPVHMMVEVASFRPTLSEKQWRELEPDRTPVPGQTRAQLATRLYRRDGKTIRVATEERTVDLELEHDTYWSRWESIALTQALLFEEAGGLSAPPSFLSVEEPK